MPIELPDNLAVADYRGVERVETAPVHEGSSPPRERVELPVHRITEGQITVPEEIEALERVLFGRAHDVFVRGGPASGEEGRNGGHGSWEETRWSRRLPLRQRNVRL